MNWLTRVINFFSKEGKQSAEIEVEEEYKCGCPFMDYVTTTSQVTTEPVPKSVDPTIVKDNVVVDPPTQGIIMKGDVGVNISDNMVVPIDSYKYPEFEAVFEKFNIKTDILIISEDYIKDFDDIYKGKMKKFEDKIIFFPGSSLLNVAIVKAGYSY